MCIQEVAELKEDDNIFGPMATAAQLPTATDTQLPTDTDTQLPIATAGVSGDLNRILSELQL